MQPAKSYARNLQTGTPWNDSDPDGDLTYRLALIEANKAGVRLTDKPLASMSRSELFEDRSKARRFTNELLAQSRAALDKNNSAESEQKLKLAEEVSRWAQLLDRQIGLNEIAVDYQRGGQAENQFKSASGKRIQVLGKNDLYADTLAAGDLAPEFGFGEYVAAMVRGTDRPDVRNALSEGTDSAGGYTVPKYLMAQLIDRMRAKSTVIRAGALFVPLDTQQTTIARLVSDPSAGWRAENAAIAESDPTFDAVTFNARSLAVLVKISRELLDDSANIEQALMAAFAGSLAGELDRVSHFGSGTPPEPRGIFNTTDVNAVSMGTDGAQITSFSKLLDCLYENELDNAAPPSAMVMHPRSWRTIQGLADTTNQPLQPPPALAGLPQLITTSVPITQTQGSSGAVCSTIIVGDYTQLLIGVRQELRIEVLRERYAENHQYAFVAHLRADIAVAHPESFCKLIGILP